MKRIVWAVVLVAIVGGAVVAFRGRGVPVKIAAPSVVTVRDYIAEDGKTRLGNEFTVAMPVSGTVDRIDLEVGDLVQKDQCVAVVDRYEIEQRIRELESLVARARAGITGVEEAKPKAEDLASSDIRVTEMADALGIARKGRAAVAVNFGEAEKAYARAKNLVQDGAVSQSYLDEAEARYKALRQSLDQAALQEEAAAKALSQAEIASKRLAGSVDDNEYMRDDIHAQIEGLDAQLSLLRNDLKKTDVCAPVAGPVLEKLVDSRRVLPAGTPLLRIGDLESIEIESDVLSEEVGRVKAGDEVEIGGKALQGKTLIGTVSRIYPSGFMKISSLGVEQQRVKTIVEFENAGIDLRPGTSVDLKIITAESADTIAVPDRAAFRREGQWSVFRVINGRAVLTPVTLGLRNDEWAEITGGLSVEDRIIAEPKNELEDGTRVAPL